MEKTMTGWIAVLVWLVPAGSLVAHHSIASFDTTTAVRVKGTIVEFHQINPHSFIFLEQKSPEGEMQRWAVEGPSSFQLRRSGFAVDTLKIGAVVEVCGYVPKEKTMWQIATPGPTARSLAGRLLNAELLVMPDGQERSWGDYGAHKCFAPGYTDQHSR